MRFMEERARRADQLGELLADSKEAAARVRSAAEDAGTTAIIISAVAIVALVIASVALVIAVGARDMP